MALALNDLIQLEDHQLFEGQRLLNVYHFRVDALTGTPTYEHIDLGFTPGILEACRDMQSMACVHDRLIIKNLTNGVDIYEDARSITGSVDSAPTTSFEALAFRLIRSNLTTRHGAKRIGGLTDIGVVGNNVSAGLIANAALYSAALLAGITYDDMAGNEIELAPVIIGRFPQAHAQAGELNLAVVNPVQDVQLIRVTSQATRRAGRGS